MGQALLRGSTQIMSGSITADRFVSGLALASSQLADGANFLKKDGSVAMTAAFNAGSQLISSVATPVSAADAATKSYVDSKVAGFQIHFARLAAASNVSALSGEQTIDGVTTSASRVFLFGQTTQSQNGLWITASGSWTRPTDWPAAGALQEGQYVIIDNEGTTYKNTKFFCTNTGTVTVDTTAATFTQDSSGTSYSASGVINLTGSVFSLNLGQGVENDGSSNLRVKLAGTSLTRGASGVAIAPGTAGQVPVTNSGATDVAMVSLSGDATMTAAGVVTVAATLLRYANVITGEVPSGTINGTNTAFTLANTPQLEPAVYLNGQRKLLGAGNDYTRSGATITFLTAPLSGDQILTDYEK